MESVIDSDKVFNLTVSDTSIILKNKEIKENRHRDGLSKFFSKIKLYCKLLKGTATLMISMFIRKISINHAF